MKILSRSPKLDRGPEPRQDKAPSGFIVNLLLIAGAAFIVKFAVETLAEQILYFSMPAMLIDNSAYMDRHESQAFMALFTLLASLGFAGGVILFCKRVDRTRLSRIGLGSCLMPPTLLGGWLAGILMAFVTLAAALLCGTVRLVPHGIPVGYVIAFFICWMVYAFSYELFCRGYLLMKLSKSTKLWVGILLSVLLSTFVVFVSGEHSPIGLINSALLGTLSAVMLNRFGNLWCVGTLQGGWYFVLHTLCGGTVNGQAAVYSVWKLRSYSALLSGGDAGLGAGLIATVVLAAALLGVLFIRPLQGKGHEGK